MSIQKQITLIWAVFGIGLLVSVNVVAQEPAKEEWVDVPTVVNLIGSDDANDVEGMIREANATLKQARIRLVLKKTIKNVQIGNGDGDLTSAEGIGASNQGQEELKKIVGAGKGIKIAAANDVWTEKPDVVGWNIHRTPVVLVETGSSQLQMGQVMAHEIGHFLTLEHIDDPNNLMYPTSPNGQDVDPNQTAEIFREAKKRGTTYLRKPEPLPEESETSSNGVTFTANGYAAALDNFGDVLVTDPLVGIPVESNEPAFNFADLGEVTLFADDAFDPCSVLTTQWNLRGLIPPDHVDFYIDFVLYIGEPGGVLLPDGGATVHRSPDRLWDAQWRDASFFPSPLELPRVFENERFDGNDPPELVNQTIELDIPIAFLNDVLTDGFSPGSSDRIILVHGNSWVADFRADPSSATILQDTTGPFEFDLVGRPDGPDLSFVHNGVAGLDFPPLVDVGIWVDDVFVDTVQPVDDGTFIFSFPPPNDPPPDTADGPWPFPLNPGTHSVLAQQLDDSGPNGAAHAIGFFDVLDQDDGLNGAGN